MGNSQSRDVSPVMVTNVSELRRQVIHRSCMKAGEVAEPNAKVTDPACRCFRCGRPFSDFRLARYPSARCQVRNSASGKRISWQWSPTKSFRYKVSRAIRRSM